MNAKLSGVALRYPGLQNSSKCEEKLLMPIPKPTDFLIKPY